MDEIDQAQVCNEDFQAFALGLNKRSREPNNSTAVDCIDCGGEIPATRRQAMPGCLRCIECQTLHEHWRTL